MPDGLDPFIKFCPITPEEANRVSKMVESKFPIIEVSVVPNNGTYGPYIATPTTDGRVWVGFLIPREGVSIPDFLGEFCKILNQESTLMIQRERG